MDTEGLGALDEDSNHDVRVFSLAILLSSQFIYNSMGSIDENALNSMSLVINLTKNIQIRSQGSPEDIDPEEYSRYFPNFIWVVRDFTLQLVDDDGEPISSKEYLEKALATQKGFTDAVEHKNRIRKLLKSFFPDRDCVTLVRPMTDEKALQNLVNTSFDDMRPEFVNGVKQVRKKIVNRMKAKKMHGKNLNGAMLYNLAANYVEAINNGAVPNIETAWTYLCQNECHKAVASSYELFEKEFQEQFDEEGPFSQEQLETFFREKKSKAQKMFKKIAVGDDLQETFEEELKKKIKKKYESIKGDNSRNVEMAWQNYLMHQYASIEQTLQNQEYEGFEHYLGDVHQFSEYVQANPPIEADGSKIICEFLYSSIQEASLQFIKSIQNELSLQQTMQGDKVQKLETDLRELRLESKETIENLEAKLTS